jgi:hypothetical protein
MKLYFALGWSRHQKIALIFCFFVFVLFSVGSAFGRGLKGGDVSVRGYVRKDGTYVQPHMRSAPDGNTQNNWSTYGNVNPYTGKEGTKVDPGSSGYGGYAIPTTPSGLGGADSTVQNKLEIPQNAKLNYYGNGWECQKGFHQQGSQCVAVEIPQNAKLNYYGNGWECQKGFHQQGSECVAVEIPQNAKLNYYGNGWECQKGFHQQGSQCVAVEIPQNAKLNYYGNGWECQKGFRQQGSECVAVEIPQNAKLNYYGNGWECKNGFRQQSNECVGIQ